MTTLCEDRLYMTFSDDRPINSPRYKLLNQLRQGDIFLTISEGPILVLDTNEKFRAVDIPMAQDAISSSQASLVEKRIAMSFLKLVEAIVHALEEGVSVPLEQEVVGGDDSFLELED